VRLRLITLRNFRQFKGEQTLDLVSDNLKPVSLVFGANGAGKTTLLNAFTWALYGSLSEDVELQDRLVTDSVWRALPIGDSVNVGVEMAFDHEGKGYRVLRQARLRKESDHQQRADTPDVLLWTTKADGSSSLVEAPQATIYTILPRGVSRFFFFNGERIENLVKKGAYAEVQQDIKVLLDLEQVERALVHLPKVDRRVTADLRKHGGDKASEIQTEIDDKRERAGYIRDELKLLEANVATLNEEHDSVVELLRHHTAAAPLQQQRDAVTKELSDARIARDGAVAERANIVATRGFLAFTESMGEKTAGIAESLYQRGALPAPLKREFVEKLLADRECICGTALAEGTEAWEHVQQWRQRAGLQAVETAWQKLGAQIDSIVSARVELRNALASVVKRIGTERDRVSRLEASKTELDDKLRDSRLEDVQKLESKRIDLEQRISVNVFKTGQLTNELTQVNKEIEQKNRERSRAEVKDELAAKARARSDMVQRVRGALEEILAIRAEDMRRRLDAELKSVFRSITHKNYTPTLSENFELTLHTSVDGVQLPVAKSTGENQILSLSFVAAVSKLAREIRTERHAEGSAAEDAGVYPIVMDAAFGSLDSDYQREVSRALAEMAPQLVVLVSKSQGLGTVVTELKRYVSHLSIIETHTTLADKNEEDIELGGQNYAYIRHAQNDYSTFEEIK
jgi:DNA sulfur modification protein DndD